MSDEFSSLNRDKAKVYSNETKLLESKRYNISITKPKGWFINGESEVLILDATNENKVSISKGDSQKGRSVEQIRSDRVFDFDKLSHDASYEPSFTINAFYVGSKIAEVDLVSFSRGKFKRFQSGDESLQYVKKPSSIQFNGVNAVYHEDSSLWEDDDKSYRIYYRNWWFKHHESIVFIYAVYEINGDKVSRKDRKRIRNKKSNLSEIQSMIDSLKLI